MTAAQLLPKQSVRYHAKQLVRRVFVEQKQAYLSRLATAHGAAFAEQVARYADAHPSVNR